MTLTGTRGAWSFPQSPKEVRGAKCCDQDKSPAGIDFCHRLQAELRDSIRVFERLGGGEPVALGGLAGFAELGLPAEQVRDLATLARVGRGIRERRVDRSELLRERGEPRLGLAHALP